MLLLFGDCELDLERRELRKNSKIAHTRAKVFDVLSYLVANRERVVHRDELIEHNWPGLNVSDTTLSTCILSIRRAIGDDVHNPRFIKTLRGQGFRFIADVTPQETSDAGDQEVHTGFGNGQATDTRKDSLSIAVLPFVNLNKDSKLDFLADGLAEDIITELSRFKAFAVIARNTSFQYRAPDYDIQKTGAELQVDYILEGSVRCDDDLFRASAQLTHMPTMTQIWTERFDGGMEKLLALQGEISRNIITNMAPEIDHAEIRRASSLISSDLKARELAWQARALMDRARTEGNSSLYGQGLELAEAAASQDPNCRHAWWTISIVNCILSFARLGGEPSALLIRAREAAEKLRALDRNDHSAYMALGWISYIGRDVERAHTNLDQAHALNPNCTMTLMLMGVVVTSIGDARAGYDYLSQAMRLSPRDYWLGFMLGAQALTCFALERYEEAAGFTRQAIEREPYAPANHAILAACLAETGDLCGAGAAIHAQRGINDLFLQEYIDGKRVPFQTPEIATRYTAALNRAADAAAKSAP